jgi:16S rRNA (guanine527-N7)-methyltransferase
MNKELFKVELSKKGIDLSEQQNEQFAYYFKRLVEQNKLHNLTSITDEEGVYEKHFFDSISVGFGFDLNNLDVLDVGSGGGFPGMPLRIAFPNMKLSILDSTAKKIVFLDNLAKEMELKNVTHFPMFGNKNQFFQLHNF